MSTTLLMGHGHLNGALVNGAPFRMVAIEDISDPQHDAFATILGNFAPIFDCNVKFALFLLAPR
ncbi:hypothetical protein [Maricaulis sp. D1M11]|uniref:hypothetical protein n=1 Tax=Maricaulis sp. D1M11 TaxID=3076117 RepID=UPI0039B6424F